MEFSNARRDIKNIEIPIYTEVNSQQIFFKFVL